MKRVVGPAGYTIVETMIFLGVSALLFVSASLLISGKQRKTQFATTVRDFSSKLQSVNGNVASGYYNSAGKVKCLLKSDGKSIDTVTLDDSGGEQGTNGRCIFLGQVLVSPQTGTSDLQVISLVGSRTVGSPPKEVTSLFEAQPKLFTDTAETYTLAGADFISVKAGGVLVGAGTNSSVAFIGSFTGYNSTGSINNGASHTDVYPIGSNQTSNGGGIEFALRAATPPTANPANIEYCIGNGEQRAIITLTGGAASYVVGDNSLCT